MRKKTCNLCSLWTDNFSALSMDEKWKVLVFSNRDCTVEGLTAGNAYSY